jgi:cold shock CspA family protein
MSSSETPNVSNPESTESVPATFGRVKWFNNKAGYGFITITSGEHNGSDVFVHHSAIQVSQEQYRYLVQGEYVEFKLCSVKDETHKWQAGIVKGIDNGKLMCETRLESRENRATRKSPDEDNYRYTKNTNKDDTQPHYRIRSRGPGPREGDEWMLVRRRPQGGGRSTHQQTSSPQQEVLRSRTSKMAQRDGNT